ncbi:SLC13 family permease [Intestinimonas butyriciproducens]|uniref:SLC13 family permease n=2 Tax=Intestinimonas butyriciproducens TaxID=1297617 RepID=UPI00232E4873|nr:SLC13 family permease [Intestinimonas butyriciproducens]MDB7861106.1 SLC13 family permease [Intestinimonas butyriciproducens]
MWTKMGKSRVCSELGRFAKREAVLCIAFFCAVVSMLFVPPDRAYLGYLDIRVLALLFCLMMVVAGLEETGLFQVLAQRLLVGRKRFRILSLALVLLPFFSSMLITNDVALLTFVPFAILMLELIGRQERLAYLVVLQTVAANLGSMATPVGNPQNLFLCSKFEIPMGDFFAVMLPLTAVSLLGLCAAALCVSGEAIEVQFCQARSIENKGLLWLMLVLFGLSLLSVFRVLPYGVLFAVVVLSALFCTRPLFLRVDYGLLATFVCFFLFSGNLGRIPAVRELLTGLLGSNTAMTAGLASQVISNVPAAVLLSGFTEDWRGLLVGTDVGGLGTPIASLASLISLKLYLRSHGSRPGSYLGLFLVVNGVGILLMGVAAWLFR